MAEAHHSHTFQRGDDWIIDGSAHNPDWSPLDLTGATIEWELRPSGAQPGAAAVISLTTEDIQIIDAAAGDFRIFIPRAITTAIAPGAYIDQCRVTKGEALRSTQWYGVIEVADTFFEPAAASIKMLDAVGLAYPSPEIGAPTMA